MHLLDHLANLTSGKKYKKLHSKVGKYRIMPLNDVVTLMKVHIPVIKERIHEKKSVDPLMFWKTCD